MEDYLRYIANIVADAATAACSRCTASASRSTWRRRSRRAWPAIAAWGRCASATWPMSQEQHDVYGSVVLAATQLFFDQRLTAAGDAATVRAARAARRAGGACTTSPTPACGNSARPRAIHTYSSVMCWAACDRLAKIATQLGLHDRAEHWRERADRHARARSSSRPRTTKLGTSSSARRQPPRRLPAAAADLGFVKPDDPRFSHTVEAIGNELRRGDCLFRYVAPDDFGSPETSFTICTFWYIDALAAIGRREEARALFETHAGAPQPARPAVGGPGIRRRRGLGQFPADLFARRPDHRGDAAQRDRWEEAFVSRLVVVSNRVALPSEPSARRRPGRGAERALERDRRPVVRLERRDRRDAGAGARDRSAARYVSRPST